MTDPAAVRTTSKSDRTWADLAAELTPAKSLARVDTVTARAITTITVLGVLLTGLGTLTAGLPSYPGTTRGLAIAAVITAALAVASALTAQVLTISRRLNPHNLTEVKAWYRRQFRTRAYPTQAATILLLAAALLAGATAATALATSQATTPAITVTQVLAPGSPAVGTGTGTGQVTVTAAFRGVPPGQVATVIIASLGRVLARAAATPASDGTTAITLTVGHLNTEPITIIASGLNQTCQATLTPSHQQATLTCGPHSLTRVSSGQHP